LRIPTAVIESDAFLADAKAFFTEDERAELVLYIAMNPDAGVVMPETGGVRKLRWGCARTWQEQRGPGDLLLS
jgi:hypothetical protein